jgi:hypothetical protein
MERSREHMLPCYQIVEDATQPLKRESKRDSGFGLQQWNLFGNSFPNFN